jgi:hypothetical protein
VGRGGVTADLVERPVDRTRVALASGLSCGRNDEREHEQDRHGEPAKERRHSFPLSMTPVDPEESAEPTTCNGCCPDPIQVIVYSGPDPPSGGVSLPPLAVIAPHWTQFDGAMFTVTVPSPAASPTW